MLKMELREGHKVEYTSDTSKFITLECVKSLKGKICTVLGKKFILAPIQSCIELVTIDDCFSSTDEQWNFFPDIKAPELTCKFLYGNDSEPSLLKDLDDGTEVLFDALRYGNSGNYFAFIVWTGPKCPSIMVEPLSTSHILYRQHLGVPVKILYLFKDSGNLSFESKGTPIYVQFFKDNTRIKMNGLFDIEWSVEIFLQNYSKFVANIYEFRSERINEEPKFICTHMWLKSDVTLYSEGNFNFNTLYNFDQKGALLNNVKPSGIIKHCYQAASISISSAACNIDLTINYNQECSFSCPINNSLNDKLKPLLDRNNKASIQVHVKEVCSEQQKNQRWSLYLTLNKSGDSNTSEFILKTFGEHILQQEAGHGEVKNSTSGTCKAKPLLEGSLLNAVVTNRTNEQIDSPMNLNENKTFSMQNSDKKASKLDLIVNKSEKPLIYQCKESFSNCPTSPKKNVPKTITDVNILKSLEDDQCLIHSKKPGCKTIEGKHRDELFQRACVFEKSDAIDSSNVELWKEYFKLETPQISEATEASESINTYLTATEFFNSIVMSSAHTDVLKSCHYFHNTLKKNPNSKQTSNLPLALLNCKGSMFAIKDKVLILTSVANNDVLISTKCAKDSILNYSSYRIPLLLWRDGKPAPPTEFIKGLQVKFDAVITPGHNYYEALLIWTGVKPTFIPFLKISSNILMLSEVLDNVSVTHTVLKSGEKQIEFIDGNEIKICKLFGSFKFKANKTLKGHINKLIEIHNNEVISHYIFSLHSNCLELEFGQQYTEDKSTESFTTIEMPDYGGLHLDVPVVLIKGQGCCIVKFRIGDERVSMSTSQSNLYFQELFRSSSTELGGIAHIIRQECPRSFNVLMVSINDEIRSGENQYSVSNSTYTNSGNNATTINFIFNMNENHFQSIEIDFEVDPTFDPQETSLNYMMLPKLTFSPECKSVAGASTTTPAKVNTSTVETLEKMPAEKVLAPSANKTDRGGDRPKKKSTKSALDSCRSLLQKLNNLLMTNTGKVSDKTMCIKNVFRNCSGRLYLNNKVAVIDVTVFTRHIQIFPWQEGFIQVDGRVRKLSKVDKPICIKLDMFYDDESKRHKITALWTGKKLNAMIVSNKEQHYFDVIGQFLGKDSRVLRLQCLIDGNFVNIVTYKSKRVFDENGTKAIDELTTGCPVLVHLKKTFTGRKHSWEILMMIEISDKIIDHLFPHSVVSHGANNLIYTASMISKLNNRKLQINEITKIWKDLTSTHFSIIFGKIISEELELIAIEGTSGRDPYNIVIKKKILLDSLWNSNDLSKCEICLIGVPRANQLTPIKILAGWYQRLLVHCFILVDYTHEQIKDDIVKLKNSVTNNSYFAFMKKNVCRLNNTKSSFYYLVQHCPPIKSLGLEITEMVLLCSDDWLFTLTCMMTMSKEFDGKINQSKCS